jgi:hypothetical protein
LDFSQRPQLLPILSAATIRFRGALDRATKSEQKRADENDGHFKALYAQKDGKMEIRGLFERQSAVLQKMETRWKGSIFFRH